MRYRSTIQGLAAKPFVRMLIVATAIAFVGAVSQTLSLVDGLNIGLTVTEFTALFIALPCWLVAKVLRGFFERRGFGDDAIRVWLWRPANVLAYALAAYTGVFGARDNADDPSGLSAAFYLVFYIACGFLTVLVTFISGLIGVRRLKRLSR